MSSEWSTEQAEPPPTPAGDSPGDQITVGDVRGSIAAFGRGAQVTIEKIEQKMLSMAEELDELERREVRKLGEAMVKRLQNVQKEVNQAPLSGANPFKGLLEYTMADARCFGGREAFLGNLLKSFVQGEAHRHLLVLHGVSGIGKTSLLEAGLVPALIAEQHLPLSIDVTKDKQSLVTNIKRSLLDDLDVTPRLARMPLQGFIRQVAELLPGGKQVIVLLDQFEAFFDMPPAARQEFVSEMARCLDDDDPRDHWLICVRSPHFSRLSEFAPTITQPFANVMDLRPLTRAEAQTAVEQTCDAGGLAIETGLLDVLLDDLGGDEVDPARLQLVCHTLAGRLRPGENRLTLATYEQSGRGRAVWADHLNSVMARTEPPDHERTWQILAAIANQLEHTSTPANLIAHMKTYDVDEPHTRRLLDGLESDRLLRLRDGRYELTSNDLLEPIKVWAVQRASAEQMREEVARQWKRVRGSALRGLLGGAVGFGAAYAITAIPEVTNYALLPYMSLLRAMPGGIAGLALTLGIDIAFASYHGPHRRKRWLMGMLAGALGFLLAVTFHLMLQHRDTNLLRLAVKLLPGLEGLLWGGVTGLVTVWVIVDKRPLWLKLLAVALAGSLSLFPVDLVGHAYSDAPYDVLDSVLAAAAGAITSLCVALAVLPGASQARASGE